MILRLIKTVFGRWLRDSVEHAFFVKTISPTQRIISDNEDSLFGTINISIQT